MADRGQLLLGLTHLAVYRPLIVLTALVAVVLFGVVSYLGLGLDQVPEIKTPIVTVQLVYPGAGPKEVEEQVTRKAEDALSGLSDIEEMTSISSQNLAVITIKFRESVDVDITALDVERTINGIRRELPPEVEDPVVRKLDLNDQPIIWLALTTTSERTPVELYRVGDEQIRPRLEGLTGVSAARVVGGRKPEVGVEVQPDRLRAWKLSFTDVTSALANQFQTVTGGIVKRPGADVGREYSLRVEGRAREEQQLGEIPVTGREGQSIELRNVAQITFGGAEQTTIVRLNGRDAVGMLVSKQAGANITQVADRALAEIARINAELPHDLQLEIVLDRSQFIRASVNDVQKELALAAMLTGVVILLFLHTARATVIVLVAIPTSIVGSFIVMKQTGLTLNILSLLGLTTSIGILVDDSIVVLENIFKRLEQGDEPKEAAVRGRSEIGLAAVAITLVDVVVYGPIVFLSGTTGGFLRNFALVLATATILSLLVSFTLTPMMAAYWLKPHGRPSLLSRVTMLWEPIYRATERLYGHFLGWALRHRLLILAGTAAMLVGSLTLVPRLGMEFVPDIDSPYVVLSGELPGGTLLETSDRAARRWEAIIGDHERFPEVKTVYMLVGSGGTDLERGSRYLSAILELVPRHDRHRTSNQVQRAVLEAAAVVPGLSTKVGGNRPGGVGQAAQARLIGRDIDSLAATAEEARQRLSRRPELVDVSASTAVQSPEIVARVDQRRLVDLGLTTQQVGAAVRIGYQGLVAAKWPRADGSETDIRVRLPESYRRNVGQLGELPLLTSRGQLVTLSQVAELSQGAAPARINRINRQRVAIVGADPASGVPLNQATAALTQELRAMQLPPGVRWELAGQSKDQQEAFSSLAMALGISVVLVYMVLTALYESAVMPLVVLSSLPLALIGALLGLLIFGNTLNILALIGVIALFGLVGKNGILLVDYANQLRKAGVPRDEALRRAGPARLRPILMTSLTLILGLLPVALNLGEGGELRAPLAAVIVGGMITNTVMTLVFVPVSYTIFDGIQRRLLHPRLPRFGRRRRRRPAPLELGGPVAPPAPRPQGANGRASAPAASRAARERL